MWNKDYGHRLTPSYDDPFLDLLPEYQPDYIDDDTELESDESEEPDEPEGAASWKVWIEYADGTARKSYHTKIISLTVRRNCISHYGIILNRILKMTRMKKLSSMIRRSA